MTVIGGPESATGYTWWELEGSLGKGWAAGEFLRPSEASDENVNSTSTTLTSLMAAPWPAGVTLHAAGDGYGYYNKLNSPTHYGKDKFAMDFNGDPSQKESKDKGLLVLSVADGCVKEVELSKIGYGWTVVISHYGGYEVRYAHLKDKPIIGQTPSIKTPDCQNFVTQGQPLGQIAGTGTKDNAVHLHYAVYFCDPNKNNCTIKSKKPEPMENAATLPTEGTKEKPEAPKQVKSQNFSVGHEVIEGGALYDPSKLNKHPVIIEEYREFHGQSGIFGRAENWVQPFLGTDMHFQRFAPNSNRDNLATMILEVGEEAYVIPNPIDDFFVREYPKFGLPNASAYVTNFGDGDPGWRVDFSNASLFWEPGQDVVVWDVRNAPWSGRFCAKANQFNCLAIQRQDPSIDFEFTDSNNPGPTRDGQGFSAAWVATLDGGIFSRVSLKYEVQGNAKFYIDGRLQGKTITSEDAIIKGNTSPRWHVGDNRFEIFFWQAEDKPARIKLEVQDGFIQSVHAFSTDGTLKSMAYQAPSLGPYADFEPPDYPDLSWDLVEWLKNTIDKIEDFFCRLVAISE